MAIILNNFKSVLNNILINEFDLFGQNKYFVYEAKASAWAGDNGTDQDASPPLPVDCPKDIFDVWRNLIGIKRISSSNTRRVVRRYDWEINTNYDQYQFNKDLASKKFYVLSNTNRVYKCISNNGGEASTIEPTGTTTETIELSDGYKWKFMYQLSENDTPFLTRDYMPISFLTGTSYDDIRSLQLSTQNASIHGGVYFVELTEQGGIYEGVISPGSGTDATEDPVVVTNAEIGDSTIELRQKTDGGVGSNNEFAASQSDDYYNDNFVVYITSGPGEGQARIITDYDGDTGIATVNKPWDREIDSSDSKYKILPRVDISGDGTEAEIIPVVESGTDETKLISKIKILNKGQNYTTASVTFYRKNAGAEESEAKVQIAPPGGHGFNAANELLGASTLIMVKVQGDEDGDFSADTKFRRYGIIKNPILQSTKKIAGNETLRTKTLQIKNPDPLTVIYFESSTDAGGRTGDEHTEPINTEGMGTDWPVDSGYEDLKNIFSIGTKIYQGSNNDPHQARGDVVSWDYVNLKLTIRTTNGRFLDSDETSDPIVIEDAQSTDVDSAFSIDLSFVDRIKILVNASFVVDDYVLGLESLATAQIISWSPSTDGLTGTLQIKNIQGNFIEPYIDSTGIRIDGENISRFKAEDDGTITSNFYDSLSELILTIGRINSIETDESFNTIETYRQTHKLKLARKSDSSVAFTETTFSVGDTVTGSHSEATGVVVSWNIDEKDTSGDAETGILELSDIRKKFTLPNSTDYHYERNSAYGTGDDIPAGHAFDTYDTLFVETDDSTDALKEEMKDNSGSLTNAKVLSETLPELVKGSGEVLYIENVKPIQRGNDQTEELKILVRF